MASLTTVFLFSAIIGAASADCYNGWTRFDDFCYRLYRNTTSWPLALFDCEKKDAYLATLDTPRKIQNIHALMRELNGNEIDNIWMGLTDVKVENVWVWEYTGQNCTHFDWGTGEPNQQTFPPTQQDCAMMYGKRGFSWADDDCTSHFEYLCERPLSAN